MKLSVQHESCECKCGSEESVRSLFRKWNHDECRFCIVAICNKYCILK